MFYLFILFGVCLTTLEYKLYAAGDLAIKEWLAWNWWLVNAC